MSSNLTTIIDGHLATRFQDGENDRYPCQFRAQKSHRLLNAWRVNGDRLWECLADFADTGVIPTLQNVSNIAPFKGHPMIEILMGAGDQLPYRMGQGDSRRIALAVAEHGEDAVIDALKQVSATGELKMGKQSTPAKGRAKGTRTKAGIRPDNVTTKPARPSKASKASKATATEPLPPAPSAQPTGNPDPVQQRAAWMRDIAALNAMPQTDDVRMAVAELKSRVIASLTGQAVYA